MKVNVGSNIKKLRELKGLTQENMAEELEMSTNGYGKIERGESEITVNKLEKISEILGMSINDVLSFDERSVFNNFGEVKGDLNQIGVNQFPKELKQLYEDKIKLLEEKVICLQEKLNKQ